MNEHPLPDVTSGACVTSTRFEVFTPLHQPDYLGYSLALNICEVYERRVGGGPPAAERNTQSRAKSTRPD